MTDPYSRLLDLLRTLFQFDRADLDFGVYRIMNAKRAEVEAFLENDLLPQAGAALAEYQATAQADLIAKRDRLRRTLDEAGIAYDQAANLQEIETQLAALYVGLDARQREVYSDLYTFFSRYYQDGDFVARRRYKAGVYAIPYEGEEVKLHWANADQYYVKTTENFQDYRFRLPDGRSVHLRLVAAETDRDNNKPADGHERRFVLRADDPAAEVNGELHLRFAYRPAPERQSALNGCTVETLLALPALHAWRDGLAAPAPTAGNAGRTLLAKHLADYTAKNTFDYFVHKDLGGFLRRELDFFLKNEILHLDDLDTPDERRADRYLARLRAIKRIGGKIIAFLAQLEDFQKKLFLKKKFVLAADYCLTLDRVPPALHPQIAANDAQWTEWERLFAVSELPNAADPASVLRDNSHLVLDTGFFDAEVKHELLENLDDFDGQSDGLLISSENYQALRLLETRYSGSTRCIFIDPPYNDPPYNTGGDGFPYRDNYRHSSWLSMMMDRLELGSEMLSHEGAMFVSIDDNELHRLRLLMEELFGEDRFVTQIEWQKRYTRSNNTDNFTSVIDHLVLFGRSESFQPNLLERDEAANQRYSNPDSDPRGFWKATPFLNQVAPDRRPNLCYEIVNPNTGQSTYPSKKAWRSERAVFERLQQEDRLWWGRDGRSPVPDIKTFLSEVRQGMTPINFWSHEFAGHTDNANAEIKGLFGAKIFDTPKPVRLVQRMTELTTQSDHDDVVMDFFAGSGTTGHAVINRNREDGGNRKYILVEMGEYFDSVLKPRILKAVYSKDWRDGKPVSHEGSSHLLKYLTLESYEDTLNNLRLRERPAAQQRLLAEQPALREDYLLSYCLDLETAGSPSLLDLDAFETPFDYTLTVTQGGESRAVPVDLPETFNYLLGLRVEKVSTADGFHTVEGLDPDGARVLAIWRSLRDPETDNAALDRFFVAQGYADRSTDRALDRVYVNGDATLLTLRPEHATWQLLSTEEAFKQLMFAPIPAETR